MQVLNKNDDIVASTQVTISNVSDGEKGDTGPAGQTPQMMINSDGHLIAIYDD